NKGIDVFFFVIPQKLICGVICDARISLDIDDVRELYLRSSFESGFVPAQSLIEIGLRRHGINHDSAFAFEFLRETLPPNKSSLIVVRSNKEETLAFGCVRVDGNDGNASRDSPIDRIFQDCGIRYRNQNSARFFLNGAIKAVALGIRIVAVRALKGISNSQLTGSLAESCVRTLPVRYLDVRR